MSVGSVAVQLQFGLYVFGYLSKLAFHFMFIVVRLFVVVSSVRLACNVRGFAKFVFVGVEKIPDFILLKL